MYSHTELRQLISDISDQTCQASASSQERIASGRQLITSDAELKAMSEEAIFASSLVLGRSRD